jgi:DNA polymerase III alpha subunit (gram-positive type)
MEEAMKAVGVPDWYIWSCKKIKYMFPKAHAAAYVMMAWRIAYCKVNYPLAYYGAYFGIRADAFSYEMKDEVIKYIKEEFGQDKKVLIGYDPRNMAKEFTEVSPALHAELLAHLKHIAETQNKAIIFDYVSHEEFKLATHTSKAVVRTGECTPYANVIFVSGVVF